MPKRRPVQLTDRDYEVFSALLMTPLTAMQLLKLSQTFENPFTGDRLLKRRMQRLGEAGLVRQSRYATRKRGEPPAYYQLTRDSYRLIRGPDSELPTRRFLQPVGWSKQRHTRSLADFIVHLHVASAYRDIAVRNFRPENTVRLTVGHANLVPDTTFELELPSGRRLNYCVELDCSSERVRSSIETVDSIERKCRLYSELAHWTGHRFRVLFLTTGHTQRLQHMVEAASEFEGDSRFARFYVCRLPDFLSHDDALFRSCFSSAYHKRVGLLQAAGRYEPAFGKTRRLSSNRVPTGVI